MANVKVPALLHKMSKTAQKAWYKKNNMEMPDDTGGRSAAAAKKVKVAPRKVAAIEPNSVRAINAARQKEYMAKGGRQPIGAAGSGGNSSMAGSNMSTAKGIVAGIKAGFNPKVSLDPYESERAKKVGPRSLKLKKESVDEALSPERKRMFDLKLKYIKKAANRKDRAKPSKVDTPRTALNPAADMKLNPKPMDTRTWDYIMKNEEAEQIDEVTKKEAEKVLGGPVKTKPKMPPGKQPAGYRYVRNLARKAMKAGMKAEATSFPKGGGVINYNPKTEKSEKDGTAKLYDPKKDEKKLSPKGGFAVKKEEVEQVEEGKIAKALAVGAMALASMGAKAHTDTTKSVAQLAKERPALAQRLKDIGAEGQVPASDKRAAELQKKQDQEMPASERRAKELEKMKKEEIEQVSEKAPPGAKFERMVKHIKKGYAKGGLSKQEKSIAYATAWKAYKKNEETETTEEVEQVEEKYMGFKAVMASAKKGGARNPAAVAAAIGRKKYGKEKFQAMAAAGKKAMKEGMDAVGREDKDIDNDGDSDKTDVYLHNKRKAIGNAIRKKLTAKLEKKDGE
jgi:hypothetical protein